MDHIFQSNADEGAILPALDDLQRRALNELYGAITSPSPAVRVHAGESLQSLGFGAKILPHFEEALRQDGDRPIQRICIWRVLARAETNEAKRLQYIEKIRDAYLNPNSPDAVCAVESLSKLRYRIDDAHRPHYEQVMSKLPSAAVPHARWLLALSGDSRDLQKLADLLKSAEPLVRGVAAYALRHLSKDLPPTILHQIAEAAITEQPSTGRAYLVSAAFVTDFNASRVSDFKASLLVYARSGANFEKYEAASALGIRGDRGDLATLASILYDDDADVRVAAATAVLGVVHRSVQSLLDCGLHALQDFKIPQHTGSKLSQ